MRQGFDLIRERKKQVGVELVSDSPVSSNSLISTELGGAKVHFGGVQILVSNDRQGVGKRGKGNSLCKSTALRIWEYDSTSSENSNKA